MNSKKAEIGIGAIFLVAILVFFAGWLIETNQRECRSNKDCGSASYCGSDFACHEYPVIQQTVVKYNLLFPSLIIGIAIVAAAFIYRWKSRENNETIVIEEQKPSAKEPEEVEEITKPYYSSEGNIKTP